MLQGLYAAASGMEATQNQFNAISNDMANIDTTGYQSTEVGFQDLLYSGGGNASGSPSISTGSGSSSAIIGRSDAQGAIQSTGRSLDVAIQGPGYLQVRRDDGSTGLTRNGALQVNAQGEVTDSTGNPLVPSLKLPKGTNADDIKIEPNGQLISGGKTIGKIGLVNVPAPNQLQPDGDSMFSVTAGSGATRPAAGSTLQQGALEGSNVDVAADMTQMITAQRSYQMASQAIQYQDQMLQIANQIKR
ncbi:MAG TPA: flagellar hook-basal body protein [Solirubrobacteraceae bacterium]|jgi:flagellar basal-body rod protein FlgG